MKQRIILIFIGLSFVLSCKTTNETVKESFSVAEESGIIVESNEKENSSKIEESNSYPDKKDNAETVNIYGGKTEEIFYDENDYMNLEKKVDYYDDKNNLMQTDVYPLEETILESGIIKQEILYTNSGIVKQYNMYFSDIYFKEHGINYLIEYVDWNDNIIKTEWYINDKLVDSSTDINYAQNFPYYNLNFLKSEIFELGQTSEDRDVITTSGKYRGIRTVAVCGGDVENLTDEDYKILSYIGNSLGYEGIEDIYKYKTIVEDNGVKYTMFIQNGLETHFPSDGIMSIRYYFIGYNNELYLALVGLYK